MDRIDVFAWTLNTDPLAWRIDGKTDVQGVLRDADGLLIEDFAAPANLLLVEGGVFISVTPEDAISAVAKHFRTYLRLV